MLLAALLLCGWSVQAQQWAEMLHDGRANFYEIQAAFETEWSGMDTVRGSGWKPFKRWEYKTEERVYPSGQFPPRHLLYTEYQKFMSTTGRRSGGARTHGNWQDLGPLTWENQSGWNPGNGRINFIYEQPGNSDVVYLGTPAGGLWRTEDGGSSWSPLTDQLPSMGVSGISVHPENPDIIYIATGDRDANDYNGVGVLKSTDYGTSWETTGIAWNISDGIKSNWLLMHPEDPETLFLASNEGLFRTTDAAESWQLVRTGNIREVAFHPTNPEIIYAVSDRFYRSDDSGDSFEQISDGLPPSGEINRMSLAVSADEPDYVYVLAGEESSSGFLGLYRSEDAGLSFEERTNSPNILGYSSDGSSSGGQSWFDLALAADPDDGDRIFTGGINVWRSNSGGSSFLPMSHWVFPSDIGYTHADIHFLRYYGDRLYCGSDGGVFVSEDDGENWQDLSNGIGVTQIYRMAFSEQTPYEILVGTQDNGTNVLSDQTFLHLLGGDGNGAAVNNSNPDILYAAYPYGSLTISTDGGESFDGFTQEIDESGSWVTPFRLDPNDQDVLFAGYQSIWKHTAGEGWEAIGEFGGGTFRTLSVAPSNSDNIYGAKSNNIFRTFDGGENWLILFDAVPDLNITEIAIDDSDPLHIIVTLSGYESGQKVYESFDGGDTFENITYNLPNVPANCVIFEDSEEEGVYVGTDIGVFYTNENLASWIDFTDGLPRTTVRQLKIANGIGKIRASTYGRGVWESDLYEPSEDPPVANFTSNVDIVCVGDSVQYTDLSYNAAPGWNWTFEGGTPSTSDERDPVVFYNEEGVYAVTIEVSNANGTDVSMETNYIVVLGSGETPPFSESYEDLESLTADQWVASNPDDDVTWELNFETGLLSDQSVWIDNLQNTTGRIDELASPSIDLTDVGVATMTFKVAYAQVDELNNDRLRLYISNDCGESWVIRGQWKGLTSLPTAPPTTAPFVPQDETEWQEIVVDNITPAYLGPNFRFMFEFLNDNGNNIYIDDINITVSLVSVEEEAVPLSAFELFPNPARGETNIQGVLANSGRLEYALLDAAGRAIQQRDFGVQPAGEFRHTIHTYDLAPGMYVIRVAVDGAPVVRKLFIE